MILPERRGSEIFAAALHPAAVLHPFRLLVLAALLGLLLLGSLAVGAQLLRRDDDLAVVLPVPTVTPGPDAVPGRMRARAPGRTRARAKCEPRAGCPGRQAHGDESGGTWVELVETVGTGAVSPLGLGRDPAWFADGRRSSTRARRDARRRNTTICMVDPGTQELQPEIGPAARDRARARTRRAASSRFTEG